MCNMLRLGLCLLLPAAALMAQDAPLRVIAFGAHPDDCDIRAAGTAAKFRALGAAVKFVSVTNGDAGHQSMGGGALAEPGQAQVLTCTRCVLQPRLGSQQAPS